jgi:hypothetical protein
MCEEGLYPISTGPSLLVIMPFLVKFFQLFLVNVTVSWTCLSAELIICRLQLLMVVQLYLFLVFVTLTDNSHVVTAVP